MKKNTSRKSKATVKKTAPEKQAAIKKSAPKGAQKKSAKKKGGAAKKKASKKKTSAKKMPSKKRSQKATTQKTKGGDEQAISTEDTMSKISSVFASSEQNEYQPYPLLRIIKDDEILLEKQAREEELAWQYKRAEKAYEKLSKDLNKQWNQKKKKKGKPSKRDVVDYGDVTGIEISFRTKFGHVVSPLQYVLIVNVSRKIDNSKLSDRNITPLPSAIDGVPVKVLEGSFEQANQVSEGRLASGIGPKDPPDPDQPIKGGQPVAEIGNADKFGTLGVVIGTKEGVNFGISNKHVTSNQTIRLTSTGDQHIGEVIKAVEKESADDHFVDASYFSLQIQDELESLPYQIKGVNDDTTVDLLIADRVATDTELGFPVYKYGAKTGALLKGRLASVKAQVNVGGKLREGVMKAEKSANTFLMGGDSGSLLLVKARVKNQLIWLVIGIVFAQKIINGIPNDRIAYICHIKDVIDELGLKSQIPSKRLVKTWENIN